eukprot:1434228-Amphidinium_carterae.1
MQASYVQCGCALGAKVSSLLGHAACCSHRLVPPLDLRHANKAAILPENTSTMILRVPVVTF